MIRVADQITIFDSVDNSDPRPYRVSAQWKRVLNYLQRHGSITPGEAIQQLGVSRLAARIYEIVAKDHEIDTTTAIVLDRFGRKCRVARYVYKGRKGGGS